MQATGNNYTHNKSLSIRLSTDGFSFSVYCNSSEQKFSFVPYEVNPAISMAANLKEAINNMDILKDSYARTQVLIDSRTTYIPFERFEEERMEDMFIYNYPQENGKTILYNILSKNNLSILYCIDKSAYQLLNDHFPQAQYYSVESPVIEHLAEKAKRGNTRKLFTYFHDRRISVYAFENNKLLFANSYQTSGINDYTYYILHVWKIQEFDQQKDELHLVGFMPEKEKLIQSLRKFIRQVYIINPSAEFNRSEFTKIQQTPYDLQTLLTCGI